MDWWSFAVVIVMYLLVLVVGIAASHYHKRITMDATPQEMMLVAGRNLSGLVGIFTMTATTVGGGFINGTAEIVFSQGLIWTIAPFGIFLGLIIGGLVYAPAMRRAKYLTMYDPFQQQYHSIMVCLLYLCTVAADVLWAASILLALKHSFVVMWNFPGFFASVFSLIITTIYTQFGLMVSVAYTDIIQLLFMILGFFLALPFIFTHHEVKASLAVLEPSSWLGSLQTPDAAEWSDLAIAMTLGTIPWQVYFQRVLSVKSVAHARLLSVAGGIGALLLAIPPIAIGVAAKAISQSPTESDIKSANAALPEMILKFTPHVVSCIGLGAIVAAVMSSLDSALLSSASVFAHNIYNHIIRTKRASEFELLCVHRVALILLAVGTALITFLSSSIYQMFILAADLVFVIMLPQLTCVIYFPFCNTYGALSGYIVGLVLRIGAEVPSSSPFLKYPSYNPDTNKQKFPFRTFAMVTSLATILLISKLAQLLFLQSWFPKKADVFRSFNRSPLEAELEAALSGANGDVSQLTSFISSDPSNSRVASRQSSNILSRQNSEVRPHLSRENSEIRHLSRQNSQAYCHMSRENSEVQFLSRQSSEENHHHKRPSSGMSVDSKPKELQCSITQNSEEQQHLINQCSEEQNLSRQNSKEQQCEPRQISEVPCLESAKTEVPPKILLLNGTAQLSCEVSRL